MLNPKESIALVPLSNEYTEEKGWVRVCPYGDQLKRRTVRTPDGRLVSETYMQRITMPCAEEMARKANSLWGKIRRFRVGIPIYRGHPDIHKHSPNTVALMNQEMEELGSFAEIEAREDGLYAKPILNQAGRIACENEGLKWLSPFWWVRVLDATANPPIVEPHELISVGMTDCPNLTGGDALANETTIMDRNKIIELLGLASDVTDEQIWVALGAVLARAGMCTGLENEKADLSQKLQEAQTAIEAAKTSTTNLQTSLANERTNRDQLLLDRATEAGLITAAERPAWQTALSNESTREAKLTELAALKPKLKTSALTAGAGQQKQHSTSGDVSVSNQILSLANERMQKFGESWDSAYSAVRKSHPTLFETKTAAA